MPQPQQADKSLLRKRFTRSLTTYSDHAQVQSQIAARLTDELIEVAGKGFDRILEIGCGTGLLTELLRKCLEYKSLYLNDLVEECRRVSDFMPGSIFIPGDIETISDLPGELDLVAANAVFQWLHDLPGLFRRLGEQLVGGGVLAFSTFGPDNLKEIRLLTGVALEYPSLPELMSMLADDYDLLCCHEWSEYLEFPDPASVLRHLKLTGVTALNSPRWTRGNLEDFSREYTDKYASEKGVVLTWQPMIIIAGKK